MVALGATGCGLSLDYDPPAQGGGKYDAGTGSMDAGPAPDAGTDSGPRCTPSAELCNGIDDDCDLEIDEDIDRLTDPLNCGECGVVCDLANATPGCSGGSCIIEDCALGWGDCDANPATGCETPINDAANCGACMNECASPYVCLFDAAEGVGTCVSSCPESAPTVCGSSCVDVFTDPLNCGACGMVCALPNATAACGDGGCVVDTCDPGWGNCDDDPVNGCETVLGTLADCRSCGDTCSISGGDRGSYPACDPSTGCMNVPCTSGTANCNGDPTDGCEVATDSDPLNCGECGAVCPAPFDHGSPTCVAGVCEVACDPGYCPYAGGGLRTCVPAPTWCFDADGDSFGGDWIMRSCDRPAGTWVTACGDCNDSHALVHPAAAFQPRPFMDPAGTTSWDYNCDGVITRQLTVFGSCTNNCASGSCRVNPGWYRDPMGSMTMIPDCGVMAPRTECTGCIGGCLVTPATMQVQACR